MARTSRAESVASTEQVPKTVPPWDFHDSRTRDPRDRFPTKSGDQTRRSGAGIIMWRFNSDDEIEVFIGRMGGPHWRKFDHEGGTWTFPKGGYGPHEDGYDPYLQLTNPKRALFEAALREFFEETHLDLPSTRRSRFRYLGTTVMGNNKEITMFATRVTYDFDTRGALSNTFRIKGPDGVPQGTEYLELDQYAWVTLDEARTKLLPSQQVFLHRLQNRVEQDRQVTRRIQSTTRVAALAALAAVTVAGAAYRLAPPPTRGPSPRKRPQGR